MTLEFGDGTFYARIWFITGDEKDWMGALFHKPNGPWEFKYRFRYYAGTDNDDDDKKSWYEYELREEAPIVEILRGLKPVIEIIRTQLGGELHELMVSTANPKKIAQALGREKWTHFAAATAEDVRAYEKRKRP